jgi:integrase/recombinase XerD
MATPARSSKNIMKLIYVEEEKGYVFLDNLYRIVEYPSLYIRSIQEGLKYSPKTISHYSKVLKYFCSYLENVFPYMKIDDAIAVIDSKNISDYLKFERKKGLAVRTIRNREVVIREFLTWLTTAKGGNIRKNNGYSTKRYLSPNPVKQTPKYLTVNEVIEFIQLLHDESHRCLVHFLFDSGLRISEIPRVKKSDIPSLENFSEDIVYFDLNVKGSKGYGGEIKERKTMISRALIQRINRLHNQHKAYKKAKRKFGDNMPCFVNVHGNKLTENAISNLLYKTAKRGGLLPSKFSSHKYRHSFAVSVLLSEFDTDFINKLVITKVALGHQQIKTTEIYSNISPAAIKHLQRLNEEHNIYNRFEESQFIFDKTYLPQKKHIERRGRK